MLCNGAHNNITYKTKILMFSHQNNDFKISLVLFDEWTVHLSSNIIEFCVNFLLKSDKMFRSTSDLISLLNLLNNLNNTVSSSMFTCDDRLSKLRFSTNSVNNLCATTDKSERP